MEYFEGNHFIDREVKGLFVASTDIIYADAYRYLKVSMKLTFV